MADVNESLAWGRAVVSYTTPFYTHKLGFHVRDMSASGVWGSGSLGETDIFETCTAFMNVLEDFLPIGTVFNSVTVYKNQLLPLPTLFWLTGTFPDPANMPAAIAYASNTITLNLRTALNRRAKIVLCDVNGGYGIPTLVLPGGFPAVTNTLFDYICNNANIVTIDGENITVPYSLTVDANETLARRYGVAENTITV